jgi:hypothetical protein
MVGATFLTKLLTTGVAPQPPRRHGLGCEIRIDKHWSRYVLCFVLNDVFVDHILELCKSLAISKAQTIGALILTARKV